MGWFSKNTEKTNFNWVELKSEEQFHQLIEESNNTTIVFFKHSTRCSISSSALSRYERGVEQNETSTHVYLDLIANRPISNLIAAELKVEHQSPQVIIVKNKEVVFTTSHNGITAESVNEFL